MYKQHNCLDRETALRMWTENVTWFSNEVGKKGQIAAGQFADLIVPDRDYFRCAEGDIAGTSSLLTVVGGKVVYAAGEFADLDESPPPPAMPDWSPVRTYGGFAAWRKEAAAGAPLQQVASTACGCARTCGLHGHDHRQAWMSDAPTADYKGVWGALGCACWAI